MSAPLHLLAYVMAGLGGGLLALRSGIPAAPLAGALLGAGLVSLSGRLEPAQWPLGTRTVLEIGCGWGAFAVMAAGAIPPDRAFPHAFNSGPDFIPAGMFDWQTAENVNPAKEALADVQRLRPWRA